jgi:transcriptional regulator with XRE-family HTH domain
MVNHPARKSAPPKGESIEPDDDDRSDDTLTSPAEIGLRIRTARMERNWTQDQLASAVGVSRSAVAQWETGRAGQITGNLTRIATVLDTHVEQLMFGVDKHAPAHAGTGDEVAMLRLYRRCSPDDRQMLLRTAKRLVSG